MANITFYALVVAAAYCAVMWLVLAVSSIRTGAEYERETFHLGLCLILALGFLYLKGG